MESVQLTHPRGMRLTQPAARCQHDPVEVRDDRVGCQRIVLIIEEELIRCSNRGYRK